ncbi:GDSL-type esterase/lipase family protein [Verrucomicrobiota bacterium sgz303538]
MKTSPVRHVLLLTLAAFLAIAQSSSPAADNLPPFAQNVQFRGNLDNSRFHFENRKKGNVAFLGGSITEMEGYRPMVCEVLRKRFPETEFTFTNAGIASTCSTTGAFRLERDVLEKGPVDLFIVEFAVNDDQDAGHTRDECIRGLEGIIRHVRNANLNTDIVVTFFVNESMLKTLQGGQTPLTIEAHEAVAKHYGVSTINLAREVAQEITAGKLTWEQYGGVHPAPFGNAICARMIDELFNRAWAQPLPASFTPTPHPSASNPLDPLNYGSGRFIPPAVASLKRGWTLGVPDWQQLPGSKRSRFTSIPMLSATEPGAELSLEFEGTAVGAYIVAGPDAGIAEASIDNGPFRQVNLYHEFSKGLHYPRTVMLGTDLKPGRHKLTIRIAEETKSSGHAMRIMQFGAN